VQFSEYRKPQAAMILLSGKPQVCWDVQPLRRSLRPSSPNRSNYSIVESFVTEDLTPGSVLCNKRLEALDEEVPYQYLGGWATRGALFPNFRDEGPRDLARTNPATDRTSVLRTGMSSIVELEDAFKSAKTDVDRNIAMVPDGLTGPAAMMTMLTSQFAHKPASPRQDSASFGTR
jgi:hypothetical protein